jgi:mRNA interferase MazF
MPSSPSGLVVPLLRGDVYEVNLDPTVGAEIRKRRPAVVIQNNTGNQYSPVTIIVPISSTKEITKPLPIMVFLNKSEGGLRKDSYVDCGQIRTVDKSRLIDKWGAISGSRMLEVEKAIKISLDIK